MTSERKESTRVYEVVCTYEVEADSKVAADSVALKVAQSLAKTGVLRSSGAEGTAVLLKTSTRLRRLGGHR